MHISRQQQRIALTLAIAAGAGSAWWLTHSEGWWKVFEFSVAPFFERVIWGFSE